MTEQLLTIMAVACILDAIIGTSAWIYCFYRDREARVRHIETIEMYKRWRADDLQDSLVQRTINREKAKRNWLQLRNDIKEWANKAMREGKTGEY